MDTVDPNSPTTQSAKEADGVLVVSVWTRPTDGSFIARMLMSAPSATEPAVRVVANPVDLHAALDVWLATLDT